MPELDVVKAIEYNISKAGSLWHMEDLPWPLSIKVDGEFFIGPEASEFVTAVAMFQAINGLASDGKLGPATYSLMKSMPELMGSGELSHDFEEVCHSDDEFGPARSGVSNRLIIDGKSVELPEAMIHEGMTASNYLDDDEHHFGQYRDRESVTNFVIHESVTMSAAQTIQVLNAKRKSSASKGKAGGKGWDYGIHLNLAPDGHISCHADLVRHRLVHADQLNDKSFGIEVVNPYNPKFGRGPFTETIPGPWWCWKPKGAKKVYCLPTPAQLRVMGPLCRFLCEEIPTLPLSFPTKDLNAGKRRIHNWNSRALPPPGIVAHRDFASHADGRYILEHIIEMYKNG